MGFENSFDSDFTEIKELTELFEKLNTGPERIAGIAIGIVKENYDNKERKAFNMVKVEIVLGEKGKNLTDWIPVAVPYAGENYGFYAMPEVGDEVIVAFNMGDINKPYVIGSIWKEKKSETDKRMKERKQNNIKRIKTKAGHEITFYDDFDMDSESAERGAGGIQIHTAQNLTVALNDKKRFITIKDEKGENLMTLDCQKGDIVVKAKNSIELNAGNKSSLTLDGKGKTAKLKADNISIEASQTLKLKGQNLSVEGGMVAVKGSQTMKIEGGTMTEVKGAMVKIN